jgi:SAM-dependent methyltransferase
MPVEPNALERLYLLRLNRGPAPILDLFGAGALQAVTLALDLGVFEALDEGALPTGELAARVDADPDGLHALLRFLEAEGYVAEDGGAYRTTAMTRTWLTERSSTNMGPWLTFWRDQVLPFWGEHLESAVREGEPPETLYEWLGDDAERWATAQRGFRAAASVLADEVAANVDVPDRPARLLDVGGGHGLYAVELCRLHPNLRATVFDHPAALDVARETITNAGVGDRVSVEGGDYWSDDLGDGYDLALAFNVIHAHDGPENARLFERIADALAPGGRIAVLDQLSGSTRFSAVGRAGLGFVGLTYLTTLGAQIHDAEDVAGWLREAGFRNVDRTPIRRAGPGNALVTATLPGET